jgi:hypothetical protein
MSSGFMMLASVVAFGTGRWWLALVLVVGGAVEAWKAVRRESV